MNEIQISPQRNFWRYLLDVCWTFPGSRVCSLAYLKDDIILTLAPLNWNIISKISIYWLLPHSSPDYNWDQGIDQSILLYHIISQTMSIHLINVLLGVSWSNILPLSLPGYKSVILLPSWFNLLIDHFWHNIWEFYPFYWSRSFMLESWHT